MVLSIISELINLVQLLFERVSLLLLNSLILYSNPKTSIISSQCAINELCAIVEMAHAKSEMRRLFFSSNSFKKYSLYKSM